MLGLHGDVTVPLGTPRRIFARTPRRPLARRLPWLVMLLCLAGASAALGAIVANVSSGNQTTTQLAGGPASAR